MSRTSGTAPGFVQIRDSHQFHLRDRSNDALSDALATAERPNLLTKIHQQHLHFAAIVGIDGAGRIDHANAMLERKAGAGADLGFEAGGTAKTSPVGTRRRSPGARCQG